MGSKVSLGVVALVLMSACQLPGSQPTCNAMIDWVSLVQFGSTQRCGTKSLWRRAGECPEPCQHPFFFKAQRQMSARRNYRLKDGDAAFLEPGTPIYQVNGHPPAEQLAARFNGSIVLYRAMAPTSSTKGSPPAGQLAPGRGEAD